MSDLIDVRAWEKMLELYNHDESDIVADPIKEAAEKLVAAFSQSTPHMYVEVDREWGTVKFVMDGSRRTYHKWIEGLGSGDSGLIVDSETNEIIGIELRIPRKTGNKLAIWHDGPLRINEPFLKGDSDE